jgi:hypothetical protein
MCVSVGVHSFLDAVFLQPLAASKHPLAACMQPFNAFLHPLAASKLKAF